jgi:hypothetical protein
MKWMCLTKETSPRIKEQAQTLIIYNTTFDDTGYYSCLAGNYLGITSESALLTVRAAPTKAPPTSAPVVVIKRPDHWNQQKIVMVVAIVCCTVILVLFFFIFIMCYKSNQRHIRNPPIGHSGLKPSIIRQVRQTSFPPWAFCKGLGVEVHTESLAN